MLSGCHEDQRLCVSFDPEVDLSDDGKSRYERFYSERAAFEGAFPCEVEAIKLIKHISKNIPSSCTS